MSKFEHLVSLAERVGRVAFPLAHLALALALLIVVYYTFKNI